MNRKQTRGAALLTAMAVLAGAAVATGQTKTDKNAARTPDTQDLALERYLAQGRALPPVEPNAWMQGLSLDLRARRVNDIVTVRVEENIAATGTADAAVGKTTSTSAGI